MYVPAWADARSSILIKNESVDEHHGNEQTRLLESIFWGNKRHSTPDKRTPDPRYGYDKEEYGFRADDEYGAAEQDERYGYEMNAADLAHPWRANY